MEKKSIQNEKNRSSSKLIIPFKFWIFTILKKQTKKLTKIKGDCFSLALKYGNSQKKHLGQHFLKDESIAKDIADTLNLEGYNDVLEIGPNGCFDKIFVDKPINTYVIEIDTESVTYLDQKLSQIKR
jgi:hypothetical protein